MMSDENRHSERDLADLDARLKAFRRSETSRPEGGGNGHPVFKMAWLAFYVISELVGGVVCGVAVGWGLDKWFDTRPVFMAIFLIIGCIAAVLNVVRYLNAQNRRESENR